jgi:glycosyltransferase involved in cell wall biosynthesis
MTTTAMKRVLLLTPSMSKGGAEKQLIKIALYLRNRGYEVKILSLTPINEFGNVLQELSLPAVFLDSWKSSPYSNYRQLFRQFRDFNPDTVISFMFIAIIFARLLKRYFTFKLISSIRISVLPLKWYLPFNMTSGDDAIVYNSAGVRCLFESRFPQLKTGRVIHNEITLPEPVMPSSAEKVFTWVCVGHFRWNKDYPTLFKALARLKNKNFRVLIVGELKAATWPAELLYALKLTSQVKLLGFLSDPGKILEEADAFVLSSFSEGMPNATLEAMALAKPVVVTDIVGNHELITASGGGLLSRPRDEAHLASCMLSIMEMTVAERMAIGARGRQYISSHFSRTAIMQQWEDLLEEV